MKLRAAADKISAVSRQNLTNHLLLTFVTPDLDVNIEFIRSEDDLSRQRIASTDARHVWLEEAIEHNCSPSETLRGTSFFGLRLREHHHVESLLRGVP